MFHLHVVEPAIESFLESEVKRRLVRCASNALKWIEGTEESTGEKALGELETIFTGCLKEVGVILEELHVKDPKNFKKRILSYLRSVFVVSLFSVQYIKVCVSFHMKFRKTVFCYRWIKLQSEKMV